MLTQHRKPVSLLHTSIDLPLLSSVDTVATIYQKDFQQFHLVLTEPPLDDRAFPISGDSITTATITTPRLLWLELSPSRITMTMQGNGAFGYRHLWERGVYGFSRYWIHSESASENGQLCLRNFARSLTVEGTEVPELVRVEYELWSGKLQMGRYVLNLEIQ